MVSRREIEAVSRAVCPTVSTVHYWYNVTMYNTPRVTFPPPRINVSSPGGIPQSALCTTQGDELQKWHRERVIAENEK